MKRHRGHRISGSLGAVEIPLPLSSFYLFDNVELGSTQLLASRSFMGRSGSKTLSGGEFGWGSVNQSVDLGWSNNPNTTPTKDNEIVRVVVCLRSVQRGCAEEGERGSTPTG